MADKKLPEILANIQLNLKAPKDRTNNFGKFKFNYRNAEDILSSVKKMLDGAVLTLTDEVKTINGLIYIEAKAEISKGDEMRSTTSQAFIDFNKTAMSSEQKTGSASSYARKYALCGLFLLDDGLDSDSLESGTESVSVRSETVIKNVENSFEDLL